MEGAQNCLEQHIQVPYNRLNCLCIFNSKLYQNLQVLRKRLEEAGIESRTSQLPASGLTSRQPSIDSYYGFLDCFSVRNGVKNRLRTRTVSSRVDLRPPCHQCYLNHPQLLLVVSQLATFQGTAKSVCGSFHAIFFHQ